MNVIILAAGEGSRLRPYTNEIPKCMVTLGGYPLLHWHIACMRQCGLDGQIVVVGGYKKDKLDAKGIIVVENPLYNSTNMVTTLFYAREHMVPGENLLITYGDLVFEPKVLDALLKEDAPVAITSDSEWLRFWQLRNENPLLDAETFKVGADGYVSELGKKPKTLDEIEGQYMGLIRVRADVVGKFIDFYDAMDRNAVYDGKNFNNMYMTSFLQNIIDNGWQVKPVFVKNGWLEIDTATDLESYRQMYEDGKLKEYCDLDTIIHR